MDINDKIDATPCEERHRELAVRIRMFDSQMADECVFLGRLFAHNIECYEKLKEAGKLNGRTV